MAEPPEKPPQEPPQLDLGLPDQRAQTTAQIVLGVLALVGPLVTIIVTLMIWPNADPARTVATILIYEVAIVLAYVALSLYTGPQGVLPSLAGLGWQSFKWLVIVVLLGGCIITPVGWVMLPPGLLLLAILISAPGGFRSQRAAVLMGYVRQAVDLNLPLPPMLAAVSRSERGLVRHRLANLAREVSSGRDVAAAMQIAVPELTVREASLLAVAQRSGRLPQTLERLTRQRDTPSPNRLLDRGMVFVYPVLILLILGVIVTGIMLFIVPKFEKIFEDFQTPLPATTIFLMNSARWLGGTLYPHQEVPGLFWIFLLLLVVALFRIALSYGAASGPIGYAIWFVPGWRSMQRDRGLGDICHVLEEATAAGMPATAALRDAANLPLNIVLRQRVARWVDALSGGASLAEGAAQAGMPGVMAGLLAAGESAADLPAALGMLGRLYDYRLARTRALLQSATLPFIVLFLALGVGTVVLGLFTPLVKLIWSLVQFPGASV